MAQSEGQLFRNERDESEIQRRLASALAGAVQIWQAYSEVCVQASPENIRQVTNRIVEQLGQATDQLRQHQRLSER